MARAWGKRSQLYVRHDRLHSTLSKLYPVVGFPVGALLHQALHHVQVPPLGGEQQGGAAVLHQIMPHQGILHQGILHQGILHQGILHQEALTSV